MNFNFFQKVPDLDSYLKGRVEETWTNQWPLNFRSLAKRLLKTNSKDTKIVGKYKRLRKGTKHLSKFDNCLLSLLQPRLLSSRPIFSKSLSYL